MAAQQLNTGPEQDRLDGLAATSVEVVGLEPEASSPHLELLAYRSPPIRPAPAARPADLAATRLVFEVTGALDKAALIDDPDGHKLVLVTAHR